MSDPRTNRIAPWDWSRAGMSLLALALLTLLAVGCFADDPEPTATHPTSTSQNVGVSTSGGSALHAAISADDTEMVRILVEGGADVDARDPFGETVLHAAIDGNSPEIVEILVAAGANVDAKDSLGEPVLHRAIMKGDSDLVRILVDAGADVNITNAFGDSALSQAVHEGATEILRILTNAGDN